jgi:hypothetical protein
VIYLKLFEGFKTDDYYVELYPGIEPGDSWINWFQENIYMMWLSGNFDYDSFSYSDLGKIKSVLKGYKELRKPPSQNIIRENIFTYHYTGVILNINRYSNYSYYTCDSISLSDEYFLVRYRSYTYKMDREHLDIERYFKCDQIEGLSKFLQDFKYID